MAFLGQELFEALKDDYEASPSLATQKYYDLYHGSTYAVNGRNYTHQGIKAVLAYFTYARYVAASGLQSTKYGLVQKENEFSSPASSAAVARIIAQAKSGAIVYQERVRLFLNEKKSTYELWYGAHKRRKGQVRISAVGGTSSRVHQHPKHVVSSDECCEGGSTVIINNIDDSSTYVE